MCFPDLSAIEGSEDREPGLAVGWLDLEHPYSKGHVSSEVIARLADRCLVPIHQTRGSHACLFCEESSGAGWLHGVRFEHAGKTRMLGSAEIAVRGPDGTLFLAPDLIFHYVSQHSYMPPPEFLEALMRSED